VYTVHVRQCAGGVRGGDGFGEELKNTSAYIITSHDGVGMYTAAAGQRTGSSGYIIRACGALRRAAEHNIIIAGRNLPAVGWTAAGWVSRVNGKSAVFWVRTTFKANISL